MIISTGMKSILVVALLAIQVNGMTWADQSPLLHSQIPGVQNSEHALIKILKEADIIPSIVDSFTPILNISASWSSNTTADLGNTLGPSDLQSEPNVNLYTSSPSAESRTNMRNTQFAVALTDPDAPSRDNPEWSQICHWLFSIHVPRHTSTDATASTGKQTLVSYKPPGPPPKTGKHRYIFFALAPANGTSDSLQLTTPKDRQHWGYGGERQGVRDWADENGLVVVGANFIYAENEEQ